MAHDVDTAKTPVRSQTIGITPEHRPELSAEQQEYREQRQIRLTEIALRWPLTATYEVGPRLTPRGEQQIGWQIHVRCQFEGVCGQSVLCASNDSGAYVWSAGNDLLYSLAAHIMQCHREASGFDNEEGK